MKKLDNFLLCYNPFISVSCSKWCGCVSSDDDDGTSEDGVSSGGADGGGEDGVSGACCIIVSAVDTAGIIVFILSSFI
jgi:hypothetical protein